MLESIAALESLKNAAAAAQARVAVAFEAAARPELEAQGVAPGVVSKSVGTQLALARRESPHRGSRHLGLAKALVNEMPHTYAALRSGVITEWTATLLVQATACLTVADRAEVDARLASRLGTDSERQLKQAAQAAAYELDPSAWVTRGRKAVADRRVTVRPAPDVMAIVSGFVPVAQGVACDKALDEHAKALRAAGDTRSLAQIKADTFVERLTGQARATSVPVEVGLVITDSSLLGLADGPARVEGYGAVPAALARDLIAAPACGCGGEAGGSTAEQGIGAAEIWLRRLFTDPDTGRLVSQDRTRRRFTGHVRRLVVGRDRAACRTPYCDAPARHVDHIRPHTAGGPTSEDNGQGLCEACNYAFEAPGWSRRTVEQADGVHTVEITTPQGHTYRSSAPPVLEHLDRRGPPARPARRRGRDDLDDTA